MNDDLEIVILENLVNNEEYARKVLPFLKEEYFPDKGTQIVYDQIGKHISKYNALPTQSELIIGIKNLKGVSQADFESCVETVNLLTKKATTPAIDWLLENTESFCKERALYNTLVAAAEKMEGIKDTGIVNLGNVPEDIQNALAITFDTSVGLNYEDSEDRWERRKNRHVEKVRFSVEVMNEATNGGMNLKTITCVAGSTGGGKSAFMCAQAAHAITAGVDTLYITLEMDEDSIADRIDANLLGVDLDDIGSIPKAEYSRRIKNKLTPECGRLVIKEYPTCGAGVLEFRALLQELRLKQKFTPRFIVVDYLNICTSSRYKGNSNINSYTLVKAIAEELRGLAKEFNVAILTGTQLNRDGVDNENVSLKEISESSGLSFTVDMLFALMRTEELDKMNQVLIKQLKNRFADMARMLRFTLGVDRAKFRYFDVKEQERAGSHGSNDESFSLEVGTSRRQRKSFDGIKA